MSAKHTLTKRDLDVLHDYVLHRVLNNRGDNATDTYPEVWKTIIHILKQNGRWDNREHFPVAKARN